MERSRTRLFERFLYGLLAATLSLAPSAALAQTFSSSLSTFSYANQPFTPHSIRGAYSTIAIDAATVAPKATPECDENEVWNAADRACDCEDAFEPDVGGICIPLRESPGLRSAYSVPLPPDSSITGGSVLTYEAPPSDAIQTAPGLTAEIVAELAIQVESATRLVVTGNDSDDPLVVEATPRSFESWSELFDYAQTQLGATLIRDEGGEVIAAAGRYTRTGSVVFDDDGYEFGSLDYVAAHLGGSSGRFDVAGQTIELTAAAPAQDGVVFYLDQTDPDCDLEGDNCIEGHTWLTHAIVYHSAGARTKQISGGTRTVPGTKCERGQGRPVYHEGVPMCRRINPDAWQYNHSTGDLELADDWDGADLYIYTPRVATTYEVLANELSVNAKAILGPFSSVDVAPVVGNNVPEVELGEWAIFKDGLDTPLGEPIPIRSIIGMCGYHSSRVYPTPADNGSSASAMTADGSTGDADLHCTGGDPLGLLLESLGGLAQEEMMGF